MSALPLMKGKASLREVTEVLQTALPKTRGRPRVSRRTQAERTALSDARMFDAAMQLIVEQGTHATTLKAVGERAGYSRGLASSRFGSKDALFGQLVLHFNTSWTQELANKVGTRGGVQACLAALCAVEDFFSSHSKYMQAMYILWFESISAHNDVRDHLAAYHEIYRGDVAHWVKEGIASGEIDTAVDAECYAFGFCSFIFGTIYQWLVAPSNVDLPKQFEAFRRLTLKTFTID
ncbi:TetR/AcrR family transcriptional regulator [Sphingorhabdus sp.]|uniref:TetR/AcrR family transcriptional regulator n=2 Tax=Sphingorhabdus sp. TaxID=1902408 RepID=UPI002617C0BE|nr:TetR/AcrR family transcriptional regulator [Sphingorhabdus sp.]MDH4398203.1 TetR/AcrR family transcriptional regulator [Sphingorhabdus sp.]